MIKQYETDKAARSRKLHDRKRGLIKKADELSAITGAQVFLQIIPENGDVMTWSSNDNLYARYVSEGLKPGSADEKRVATDGKTIMAVRGMASSQVVTEASYESPAKKARPSVIAAEEEPSTSSQSSILAMSNEPSCPSITERNKCFVCAKTYKTTDEGGDWIGCEHEETCNSWAHRLCLGWTPSQAKKHKFVCYKCLEPHIELVA